MKTRQKLSALRALMKNHSLAAYLVPSTDPHQSEYVPACWQRRAYLSGFTGSAGDLLVLKDKAGLWTDGRYFLQAGRELAGSGIDLFKIGERGVPRLDVFIAGTLRKRERLGVDPRLLSVSRGEEIERALAACGGKLALLDRNLVDEIWRDRPAPPGDPVRILPRRFAGESVSAKLKRIRNEMKKRGVKAHILTSLDTIAWTFNIRSADVEYCPVVIAYAVITPRDADLYLRVDKIPPGVLRELKPRVRCFPYEEAAKAFASLGRAKAKVWVDAETTNRWVTGFLKNCELVTERTPVAVMKARKNAAEIRGMRAAHARDGVALVRFLHWLEKELLVSRVTEISAERTLEQFRRRGRFFQGPSFRTIMGYRGHGAIIHYKSEQDTDVRLHTGGIFLIDSGGQYLDGTTDVTRTILLGGRPTPEQAKRYTRVLQGHIRLARLKFPEGVRGMRLDTLARAPLWELGLDYNHGTGHGVGSFLNVHEGPQGISPTRCTGVPLEEGNILSNEPGYYKEGEYGIRIENLILVVKDPGLSRKRKKWFRFETLTLCPIDTKLLIPGLLSAEDRDWLNKYHARVFRVLSPHLDKSEKAWLKKACRPV